MFWRRRTPEWFVDPSKVAFGAVVEDRVGNLSRSHVRVKYGRASEVQFVPLATFIRQCREALRGGRSLDIEQLIVAPILKQRYAKFFDHLTDWSSATHRARGPRFGQQRPLLRDG